MHLQQQYLAVQAKLDRAYDDRLADRITDELWQRKSGEWEAELASVRRATARHEKASHDYGATGSKILELAKNAHNLFVLQDSHEQARLLKMLVLNSTFDRGSLSVSYIKPFDLRVNDNESGNWLGGRDSFRRFQETPVKTGVFGVNLATSAISAFRIHSSAFVLFRLFSDFPSPVALIMTLAAKDLAGSREEISGARSKVVHRSG